MYDYKQLKNIRHLLGLRAFDVANDLYTTRQTINNIENGRTQNLSMIKLLNYYYEEYMRNNNVTLEDVIHEKQNELEELL